MLTIEEAWARIEPFLQPLPTISVTREESRGRTLSRDLYATLDVPPGDVSAMDGFAIPDELANTGSVDCLIGPTIAAGDAPGLLIAELATAAGSIVVPRITTGAPVPTDCNRVVPVENTTLDSTGTRVLIAGDLLGVSNQHIRRRAEVSQTGQPLLHTGQRITTATASLLATHGIDSVPVYGLPRVAYATTGSEIVPPSEEPGPGQIRDSHSSFFHSALAQLAHPRTSLGIAEDDPEVLSRIVARGLDSDILLLSGGVSMGEFDLVEGILERHACEVLFDGIAMQPGKPLVAARHQEGLVFGLPGNPASAQVGFWLFVEPTLRRLAGEANARPWGSAHRATLERPLTGAEGRDRFVPCTLSMVEEQIMAQPRPPRGSHDVLAYGLVNGLARVPAGQEPRNAGESCSVIFLP